MEVIKQIAKEDINSALNRVDRSLRASQLANLKKIEDATKALDDKYAEAEGFQNKLKLYNKVVSVLFGIIQDYCVRRRITVLPAAIEKWQDTYKTSYKCETGNSLGNEVYIDWNDFEVKNTCTSCNTTCWGNNSPGFSCSDCYSGCQFCNNQQNACSSSYSSSLVGFATCASGFALSETYEGQCTGCYSSCDGSFAPSSITCQACNSGCQGCYSSCDGSFNLSPITCQACNSGCVGGYSYCDGSYNPPSISPITCVGGYS